MQTYKELVKHWHNKELNLSRQRAIAFKEYFEESIGLFLNRRVYNTKLKCEGELRILVENIEYASPINICFFEYEPASAFDSDGNKVLGFRTKSFASARKQIQSETDVFSFLKDYDFMRKDD